MLGPALIFTKDRLENMISVSSGWSSELRLLDDDSTTYWESDNRFDNEPAITIDFMDDVIINYVDLWPVLLAREKPRDAYAKICIEIQKVLMLNICVQFAFWDLYILKFQRYISITLRTMIGFVLDVELSTIVLKKKTFLRMANQSTFGVILITNGGSHVKSKFSFPISMA